MGCCCGNCDPCRRRKHPAKPWCTGISCNKSLDGCGDCPPCRSHRGHELKPWCDGVGCHKTVHEHLDVFMGGNLAAIHHRWGVRLESEQLEEIDFDLIPVGRARPEDDFPVGSEWYYGPCYENMQTRVRVVEPPKQSAGPKPLRDYSLGFQRGGGPRVKGGSYVEGPRSWFVKCEVLSSPHYDLGHVLGLPPCALIPAVAVDGERGCCHWHCCAGEDLRRQVNRLRDQLQSANRAAAAAHERRMEVERKLASARQALA